MLEASLGVDIGSVSTKGVVIDSAGQVLAHEYLWTEGHPVNAVKKLLCSLKDQLTEPVKITGVGTTGSARKLIGTMLNANIVKNEITAHAVGTLSKYPDVKTILEIGGQDSKIILIRDGIVIDYAMNTLCAAGTGAFLAAQAVRLGIPMEEMGKLALEARHPVKIAARCAVFAESDMIHKAQAGHRKEDLVAGLCMAVVLNYLGDVGQGKEIVAPVIFQGGVSKNPGVVRAFQELTGLDILVDDSSHLAGAVGSAILARPEVEKSRLRTRAEGGHAFSFDIADVSFETVGRECDRCPNRCEVMSAYRDGALVDTWGNRCTRGEGIEHSLSDVS